MNNFHKISIGIDIIEIRRIKNAILKLNKRFVEKIFSTNEIKYCYNKADPYTHFSARFAAKEAVMKAIGSGRTSLINWLDIEIINDLNGKPQVHLSNSLRSLLGCDKIVLISISHSKEYAVANALIQEK